MKDKNDSSNIEESDTKVMEIVKKLKLPEEYKNNQVMKLYLTDYYNNKWNLTYKWFTLKN